MEFHYYQILPMIIALWGGYLTGRLFFFLSIKKLNKAVKTAKQLAIPTILALLLMLFMPVKLTEPNMSVHEDVSFDIPEKIIVEETDFEQQQIDQLNKLKEESKNALK